MAANDFSTIVVCDAGPLIHLDELQSLDLLNQFTEKMVPERVWQEVKRHRPSALRRRKTPLTRIQDIPPPSQDLASLFEIFLPDPGEQEALCLMREFPNATFLTDDEIAKVVARRMGCSVHGTIGVLIRALDQQLRTKRQILHALRSIPRKSTLFIKRAFLDSVIESIERGAP